MVAAVARKRPPEVKGLPFVGAINVMNAQMHRNITKQHDLLGDIFRFPFAGMRLWAVRDPAVVEDVVVKDRVLWQKTGSRSYGTLREMLGEGLVTAEGPGWLKHRRLAQPAFHRERIAGFMATMKRFADDVADRFAAAADAGTVIDVGREMLFYTQRVIGQTMLSVDLAGPRGKELADALEGSLHSLDERSNSLVRLPLWAPTPTNRALVKGRRTLDALVYELIAERRARRAAGVVVEGGAHGDLLDMLMDAVDEDTGATLSDEELRDDVMTIFLAGHETTSNLLAWTFAALATRPDVDDALAKDLGSKDAIAWARPSPSSTLLDRVIDESMRWRPPVWTVDRVAQRDGSLGEFDVVAGDIVLVSAWALHHHQKFYPEPERFEPDRFLDDVVAGRPRYAFLPFLAGNRKCIGDTFALAEAKIALATWLPRFCVEPVATPG